MNTTPDLLEEKTLRAFRLINELLKQHRKPVIMSSFGKDSMVLVHLIRRLGVNLPVVFHREPFLPQKYIFANQVIRDWNLTVYDYAPMDVAMVKNGAAAELMNFYQCGVQGNQPLLNRVPTGLTPMVEGEPWLCVKDDLLAKPLGTFTWPWDVAFIGHKACDVDPINGRMPLQADVVPNPGGATMVFPLREFTDADIWQYHKDFNLPFHHARYDQATGQEWPQKIHNPDYFEACWACVDRDGPPIVECPKLGVRLANVASRTPYTEPLSMPYYAAPVQTSAPS